MKIKYRKFLVVCLMLMSCAKESVNRREVAPKEQKVQPTEIAIVDDLGQTVRLAAVATRLVSLTPGNTEILFALGCGSTIVLRDRASDYPAAARAIMATDGLQISVENIVGFNPQLVVLGHDAAAARAKLAALKVPTAVFNPHSIEGVLENMRKLGQLCGASAQAISLTAGLAERLNKIRARVSNSSRPRIFVVTDSTDSAKPWTVGPGSFVDEIVSLAGAQNIAAVINKPYAQINIEEVVTASPDFLLLLDKTSLAELAGKPGWSALPAVRKGQVIGKIDPALLSRPGPRLVEGLEELAAILHSSGSAR